MCRNATEFTAESTEVQSLTYVYSKTTFISTPHPTKQMCHIVVKVASFESLSKCYNYTV